MSLQPIYIGPDIWGAATTPSPASVSTPNVSHVDQIAWAVYGRWYTVPDGKVRLVRSWVPFWWNVEIESGPGIWTTLPDSEVRGLPSINWSFSSTVYVKGAEVRLSPSTEPILRRLGSIYGPIAGDQPSPVGDGGSIWQNVGTAATAGGDPLSNLASIAGAVALVALVGAGVWAVRRFA